MDATSTNPSPKNLKLIRRKPLAALLSVSEATIIRWCKLDIMPPPMRLGGGAVAWRLTEIETWLDERAQKARSETTTPANEQ